MKKVLIFGMTKNYGGIESVLMNYCRNFNRKNLEIDFLCNDEHIAYEDEIKKMGSKIYRVPSRRGNCLEYNKKMKYLFKNIFKKYDTIWVNLCNLANIDYLIYAKKYGIKKRIIHCHNSDNMGSFIKALHKLNKAILPLYATDFWSCSDEASPWFYSDNIINSDKYLLVNNAIAYDRFKYNPIIRKKIRDKIGIDNKLVFGNVGRLHFQKNQMYVIDIFKQISDKTDNAVLLLIGDGEDRQKLISKVKDYKISDKVKFLGIRKDMTLLFQAMDVLLFPSIFEGLPLSLVEAQASKLLTFTSTNVSREVKMSNCINFYDLNKSPEYWCDNIMAKVGDYKRENANEYVKRRGFDIIVEARKIERKL